VRDEFLRAVAGGDAAAVGELLGRDASLARSRDERGTSALLLALYHRRAEVAAALLGAGFELDVFEAAAAGRADRVRELVESDPGFANAVAPDGFTALGLAVYFGHGEAAGALLGAGADPNLAATNATRVKPIHSAAAARRADLARFLLDRGADPNARQQAGYAPLHQAAHAGDLELVRLLVDRGADVNAETDDGRTPLAFAGDHADVASFLRERGGR
jgi:ankyrin repeat protein